MVRFNLLLELRFQPKGDIGTRVWTFLQRQCVLFFCLIIWVSTWNSLVEQGRQVKLDLTSLTRAFFCVYTCCDHCLYRLLEILF